MRPPGSPKGELRIAWHEGGLMSRQLDPRLRLPALLAVLGHHVGGDAAAHIPFRGDADEARVGGADQVVDDVVGDLLVERAFVAVAPEVQLQALELHAQLVGDHVDREMGEVRLAGQRAVASELGHQELDEVVALGRRVGEHLQFLARRCGRLGRHAALVWWRCGGRFLGHGAHVSRGFRAGARWYHQARQRARYSACFLNQINDLRTPAQPLLPL